MQTEPGDDPEVVRAKYFIRDEFLVSSHQIIHHHNYELPVSSANLSLWFLSRLAQIGIAIEDGYRLEIF